MSAGLPYHTSLSDKGDSTSAVTTVAQTLSKSTNTMPKPCNRVLETDLNIQFSSRGKDPIARLLWYLWEDQEIFKEFVDNFMVK